MAMGIRRTGNSGANTFIGTADNDTLDGNGGDDRLYGRAGNDLLTGGDNDDLIYGEGGDDRIFGGTGNDRIFAGAGNDIFKLNVSNGGADQVDLGVGSDVVRVESFSTLQARLTFTFSELGNGAGREWGAGAGQDGGLAVRVQEENERGELVGAESRFGDEGVTFVSVTPGFTFDVRDLASATGPAQRFDAVALGTAGEDRLAAPRAGAALYANGGSGDDVLTGGNVADVLTGGAGADVLTGRWGSDTMVGGAGNDRIFGGAGKDIASLDISTDGSDRFDLGSGLDSLRISAASAGQVRLSFAASEVGNGSGLGSGGDRGLAVRIQAEDGSDGLTGPISRSGDEGVSYVATTPGLTFHVEELAPGAPLAFRFKVVTLGTTGDDDLDGSQRPYDRHYINGGQGDDTLFGYRGGDYLVGGGGDDLMSGGLGNDWLSGGAGSDKLYGTGGRNTFVFDAALDAATNVDSLPIFGAEEDTIRLDDAVFTGLARGSLNPEAFAWTAAAAEADDRIIYDEETGNLFFDLNGGSRTDAVLFADVSFGPNDLSAADFIVF